MWNRRLFVAALLLGLAATESSARAATMYVSSGNSIAQVSSAGVASPFATVPPNCAFGLAFDGGGNLYAADYSINQISKISQDGLTVTPFATGISGPQFIAFAPAPEPASTVLLAAAAGSLVLRRRRRGESVNPHARRPESWKKYMRRSNVVAATVFTLLCAFLTTQARAALSFVQSFGSTGAGSGQFIFPFGVTVDSGGNVYVTEFDNNRIDRFNPTNFAGTFTSFAGFDVAPGPLMVRFSKPTGVAVDSAGNVYVADLGNNRIDSFNLVDVRDTFASFGSAGSGNGQFRNPAGVTLDSAGNVYVADVSNNRIDRFNPANIAATFTSFGSTGSGDGQFSGPFGVTLDKAGNVYVADTSNNRIDRFNPANFAGTFASFGSAGSGSGQFSNPVSVALDSAGNVYVADASNNRIDSFNPADFAGTFISFGSFGSGDGFRGPSGVAVDSAGNVYVADASNNRIVELTGTASPEPSSAVLLAAGSLALLCRTRRRQTMASQT